MRTAIETMRKKDSRGKDYLLPERLGTVSAAEGTSDLAVRTISRAGLVFLSVLRGGKVPFATPLQLVRGALLPVAGAVARGVVARGVCVLAFWAAAAFLAARFVTTKEKPADLGHLSMLVLAVSLIALLVVLGTAALPLYRSVRGGTSGIVIQAIWGFALLGTGAGASIALAWTNGLSPGQLIVQPEAEHVPDAVLWPTLFVILGVVLVPRLGPLRSRLEKIGTTAWSASTMVFAVIASVCLLAWSADPLREALSHGEDWQWWSALVAGLVAPVVALLYLFARTPLDRFVAGLRKGS
jgi:hypothetical protein